MNEVKLTDAARENIRLGASWDADSIAEAWESGDYGYLVDSDTATTIREATADEALASYEAGPEGHIDVDGRTCYVAPSLQ